MTDETTVSLSWKNVPKPIPESEITKEYSADILVAGLGHAGTAAARAAAEAGVSVIAIEKMERAKFKVFGGQIGHINSAFLSGKGVPKVDPIVLFNEWMLRSGNRANPKLIMQFCRKSGDTFDWYAKPFTREQLDSVTVRYWPPGKNFRGTISGQKFWPGTAQFPDEVFSLTDATVANMEYAREHGADLHFGMELHQPIMDDRRIIGVIARNKEGQYVKYLARKGVILATGDFGSNREMCHDLLPDISDLFDEGEKFVSFGRDGRGIQVGVWAGGRLEARPIATMGGNFGTLFGVLDSFGTLWVDGCGRRYCNEGFGDPVFAGFNSAQDKHDKHAIIFDSSIFEDLQSGPPAHMAFFVNDPASEKTLQDNMTAARAAGARGHTFGRGSKLLAAATLEELADYIGFKGAAKETFLNTVKRYNELCRTGRDEDFGKDRQLLNAIDSPPYYAEPDKRMNIGWMMVTCGGLLTDEYQNVLNRQKDPIPGLYATGNCCGRRFGLQYSTPIAGVSIGIAITLGREVGRIVAEL